MRSPHSKSLARRGAWLALVAVVFVLSTAGASRASAAGSPAIAAASSQEPVAERAKPGTDEAAGEPAHEEPLWKTFARLFNFAIVAGVLVYYLRAPIAQYLARRSTEIRSDLVKAAETRAAAAEELKAIEQKLQALPGEIEALRRRGAEEIAAEEARIREAAAVDRARLLEQARREIDLHLRAAERELIRRAADLTIDLAGDRIKRTISDEDRVRLVEQYLAHLPKQA